MTVGLTDIFLVRNPPLSNINPIAHGDFRVALEQWGG